MKEPDSAIKDVMDVTSSALDEGNTIAVDDRKAKTEDDRNTLRSSPERGEESVSSSRELKNPTADEDQCQNEEKLVRTCMPPPSAFGLLPPTVVLHKQSVENPIIQEADTTLTSKTHEHSKSLRVISVPPLPYKTPTWSGKVSDEYSLEVLKCGIIVGNVDLRDKCYVVFGRLECCNVVMEHPSISRYHAVVQYRAEGDQQHPTGLYLYDLDSTHGTFLNKEQIRARTYYRIQVGHMFKLGGSSRVFLLQGPPDDQEEESELSVTQLKELRRREEAEKIAMQEKQKMEEKKKEEEGVDWGFGEDAMEEDPLTENPFALSTPNEDLYLDDPKKSLRGWFEREGYDLEYQVEEKGFGHFSCKILLPVDAGQSLYAEASVKGKKKEAVALCALEACRILDRYGLLRQSHHEGRKRKHKNWEDDDFYDSDEDTYLDRTGTIEKKREMRKKLLNKEEVETYDSLIGKLDGVENEINDIQNKLQTSTTKDTQKQENRNQDPLEAFMSSIQSGNEIDKKTKSNLKLRLSFLQQERTRLQKLANIAQPTSLPPLIKNVSIPEKKTVMIGSMKGGKKKTLMIPSKTKTTQKEVVSVSNEMVVEEDDDDEVDTAQSDVKTKEDNGTVKNVSKEPKVTVTETEINHEAKIESLRTAKVQMSETGRLKETAVSTRESVAHGDADSDELSLNIIESNKEDTSPKKRGKKRSGQKSKKDIYDGTNPDYAMWLPPEGQTGDGKTFLNEKFGY